MSDEVKRYEVVGRLETDEGATEEYPGPGNLVVYALDYDDLEARLREVERERDERIHDIWSLEADRDKWQRRAEAAEQRATEAELRALNMADDRPIQVSAANAETNDDLRNENKQLREALNYATQDMDHEDIAIVEQIAHGLWRWYDGAVSDDLRRENARLREAIGLPAVVFNAMKRWVADKSWDSTVLESIEIRYAGHTFYPLTQDEITERGAKPGQQIWPPVVDSANDSREAKTETCRQGEPDGNG